MRGLVIEETWNNWIGIESCSDKRSSGSLGAQRAQKKSADGPALRSLRCSAAGSARVVGLATVRAGSERWLRFRPRRDRQQGPDLFARHRNSGNAAEKRRSAGES